jgi:hypothetical protein
MVQTRKRANQKQDISSDDEMDNTIQNASVPNTHTNEQQGGNENNMRSLIP